MLNKSVYCTFRVVGFHKWPKAPKPVAYLRTTHRHEFVFKVTVEVPTLDRAIEFHTLKAEVSDLIHTSYDAIQTIEATYALDFGSRSCEMLAAETLNVLAQCKKYQGIGITVEVSEDGENGGIVVFTPDAVK